MKKQASSNRLFFREFLKSWRSTASLVPSSPFLAEAMLEPIDFSLSKVIVELGPGTGALTRELLRRLGADAALYAFETNENFVLHLREMFRDPRLIVLHASAETVADELAARGAGEADAVVSSLGLTSMNQGLRQQIVDQARMCLKSRGVLTQYQYGVNVPGYRQVHSKIHGFDERAMWESAFHDVTSRYLLFNVPPAFVFTCRGPRGDHFLGLASGK